jgi:glycosyltransferase involved in cell wall biosynthesis
LFSFLAYTTPIWYYRRYFHADRRLYDQAFLDQAMADGLIISDSTYKSETARNADLIYQALNRGLISKKSPESTDLASADVTDPVDNYRFLRKYFPSKWANYALFMRLLSGVNPFSEIRAYLSVRDQRKINLSDSSSLYADFEKSMVDEQLSNAKVSVIIPTLNRYSYLKDVFADLEKQTHRNFEVLVCDQSDPFDASCYKGWSFEMQVLRQEEKALWKARNTCLEKASGDLILLFDDDSRVEPDWIEQHIRCLSYFNAPISAGVTDTIVGHGLSKKESYFHYSDVFDTGNALVRREVFNKVGTFDRQFEKQRMGDGEFGLRAYMGGFPSISNPFAKRIHLKVETGGLRHFGSWDAFRPKNLFSPRPVPSVLYLSRRYFGAYSSVMLILNSLSSSVIPYKYKKNRRLKMLSPVFMLFISPVLLIQVLRSWKMAGIMIEQGPRIEMPK